MYKIRYLLSVMSSCYSNSLEDDILRHLEPANLLEGWPERAELERTGDERQQVIPKHGRRAMKKEIKQSRNPP